MKKVYIVIHTFDGGYAIHGVFASKVEAIREVRKHLSANPSWWSQFGKSDIWVNSFMPDVLCIDEQDLTENKDAQDRSMLKFEEHLESAKQIVVAWPEWKRNCLGRIISEVE